MIGFSYTVDGPLLGSTMGGGFIGPVYVPVNPIARSGPIRSPIPSGVDDAEAFADRVYSVALTALRALSSARSALQDAVHACPSGEVGLMLDDALFALDTDVRDVIVEATRVVRAGTV